MSTTYFEDVETGITLWRHIAEVQNDWMSRTGTKVDINNTEIWQGFLHQLNNEDWVSILHVFGLVIKDQGIHLRPDQETGWEITCRTLDDCYHIPRCLDTNKGKMRNKPIQWRMIMILREVYNRINGIDEQDLLRGHQHQRPRPNLAVFQDVA